jgi:GT2 family glycosyltransferase
MDNKKIGVAIITCDRKEFLKNLVLSIDFDSLYYSCLIIDGDDENVLPNVKAQFDDWFVTTGRTGVGIAKNLGLMQMYAAGCEHLFLIEDDMIIKNKDVFNEYVRVAEKTGLKHLNFAYHGPANKINEKLNPRRIIEFEKETLISLNVNCVGSFSYYHRDCITECGLMDMKFQNAWEHVEHTYRLSKKGFTTPFWWFADLHNSYDYIGEQACSEENSVIRKTEEWKNKFREGAEYFKTNHGCYPTQILDTPEYEVRKFLIKKWREING